MPQKNTQFVVRNSQEIKKFDLKYNEVEI